MPWTLIDGASQPLLLSTTSRMKHGCMCKSLSVCVFVIVWHCACLPAYMWVGVYCSRFPCRWGNFDTYTLPRVSQCFLQGEVAWHKSWNSTGTIFLTMKMACDCSAPIFSMIRPLGFTPSWGVTVLAFNLKPVFTFIILHCLCDWCSCQTFQQDISSLQAMVVWHGAILKMSRNIVVTAVKKSKEHFN